MLGGTYGGDWHLPSRSLSGSLNYYGDGYIYDWFVKTLFAQKNETRFGGFCLIVEWLPWVVSRPSPAPFHQASIDRGSLIVCSKWGKFIQRLVTGRSMTVIGQSQPT